MVVFDDAIFVVSCMDLVMSLDFEFIIVNFFWKGRKDICFLYLEEGVKSYGDEEK